MKLYVGNIPFSMDDARLAQVFAEVGRVASAKVITDKETGRSRGFGFVEMGSEDEGRAAIERLNGLMVEGRGIVVNEARAREDRPRRPGRPR